MYVVLVECVGYCRNKMGGMVVAEDEKGGFNRIWDTGLEIKQVVSEFESISGTETDDMCDGCAWGHWSFWILGMKLHVFFCG